MANLLSLRMFVNCSIVFAKLANEYTYLRDSGTTENPNPGRSGAWKGWHVSEELVGIWSCERTYNHSVLECQPGDEVSVLEGRCRKPMQKQDRRGFLVACFAVENIYAIDGDSLNSGGWDDVGHLFVGVCDAIQDLAPYIVVSDSDSI